MNSSVQPRAVTPGSNGARFVGPATRVPEGSSPPRAPAPFLSSGPFTGWSGAGLSIYHRIDHRAPTTRVVRYLMAQR